MRCEAAAQGSASTAAMTDRCHRRHASYARTAADSAAVTSALRGVCEDIIVLKWLGMFTKRDRDEAVGVMMMKNVLEFMQQQPGAGIVGLAVGFGAQTLVKDFLTGLFLIAEDVVSVGDNVEIGGFAGVVEAMTLRTIRLRDANALDFGRMALARQAVGAARVCGAGRALCLQQLGLRPAGRGYREGFGAKLCGLCRKEHFCAAGHDAFVL